MTPLTPRRLLVAATIAVVALVLVAPPPAQAQDLPPVAASGSTWAKNMIDAWVADLDGQLRLSYSGQGSTAGRAQWLAGTVDWAQSEIPFIASEEGAANAKGFNYIPIIAGGTALMYNVKQKNGERVKDLRLTPDLVARIFTGKIAKWDDPAIVAENPNHGPDKGPAAFESTSIRVIARSDGSGTTALFTDYMINTAPSVYAQFAQEQGVPTNQRIEVYPSNFGSYQGFSTSDGVANAVANDSTGNGGITYVETSFAIVRGFPVAYVKNQAGNFVLPTASNVATALKAAVANPDNSFRLDPVYTSGEPGAYPIANYSLMIVPKSIDAGKGKAISRYVYYAVCGGQRKASLLGYSPIPPQLVQLAFNVTSGVPGADSPPNINTDCKNPWLTGEGPKDPGPLPGTGGGGSSSGGASTSGGGSSGARAGGSSGGSSSGGSTGGASGSTGGATSGGSSAATGSGATAAGGEVTAEVTAEGVTGEVTLDEEGFETASGQLAVSTGAASVELTGTGDSTPWLFAAAGIGLLLLVLVPPLLAGAGLVGASSATAGSSSKPTKTKGRAGAAPPPPPPSSGSNGGNGGNGSARQAAQAPQPGGAAR